MQIPIENVQDFEITAIYVLLLIICNCLIEIVHFLVFFTGFHRGITFDRFDVS